MQMVVLQMSACTIVMMMRPVLARTKLYICCQVLLPMKVVANLLWCQWVPAGKVGIILATMLHEAVLVPSWLLRRCAVEELTKRWNDGIGVVRLVRRRGGSECLVVW